MKKKTLANASILTGVALAFMGRNQGSKSKKPTLTFLVGLTCVGKSHYLQSIPNDNTVILSTDNIINDIAAQEGITYDDFFETMGSTPKGRFVDQVLPVLNAQIEQATKNNVNVIVDMQNINVKSRALTYDNPKFANYIREAVVFDHNQLSSKNPLYLEAVKKACAIRGKEQNKTIPEHVIERSFNGYERPTSAEGFTHVIDVKSSNPIIEQVLSGGVGSPATIVKLFPDQPEWIGIALGKFQSDFGLNFYDWVEYTKEAEKIRYENKNNPRYRYTEWQQKVPIYTPIPIQAMEVNRPMVEKWAKKNGYVLDGYQLKRKRDIGGSMSKHIELVRIERRTAGFTPKYTMRSMSRGMMHDPNKVVGAYVTIASSDPTTLREREAREFVINEGRKIGLVGKMPMLVSNVYPSRMKADTWEARWELV